MGLKTAGKLYADKQKTKVQQSTPILTKSLRKRTVGHLTVTEFHIHSLTPHTFQSEICVIYSK